MVTVEIKMLGSHWRQRQADLYEFEANLVYGASSRTVRATQRNPVSKQNKIKADAGFCFRT